jgi:hypothetical protein
MAAQFLREMFARIVVKVGDDDYGAFLGQAASAGRAKASGAAGYKNPLPRDPAGARLFHRGMILAHCAALDSHALNSATIPPSTR